MPKAEDESAKAEDESAKAKPQEWALKTLGTIVGGIGLTTWMVIVGSAVFWARFNEAGIPGLQAVAAQPRNEMLIQGSKTTLVFAFLAFAAVVLLYALVPHDSTPAPSGEESAQDGKPSAGEPQKIGGLAITGLVLLAVGGVVWAATTSLSCWWVVALGVLAAGLFAVCLLIGRNDRKNFWALAGALFASVVVFAGVAEWMIVKDQDFVQAVAVLPVGESNEGVAGFFVAIDGETLYFAHSNLGEEEKGDSEPKHRPLEKLSIGPNAIYAVGPLEGERDAARRAEAMLRRLRADRAANPEVAAAPAAPEQDPAPSSATAEPDSGQSGNGAK